MEILYKIGVIFGMLLVYAFVTLGLSSVITISDNDDASLGAVAWAIGMVLFMCLAIFTLEKFGLWK